jgi:hypothetical protein
MSQPFIPQNNMLKNAISLFSPLSFYSPLILCFSLLFFSAFTGTLDKAFIFFISLSLATFIRIFLMKMYSQSKQKQEFVMPTICLTGLPEMIIPGDITYSTFIIIFMMTYILLPINLISKQTKSNMMNYKIIFFFAFYFALDLFVKNTLGCFVDANLVLINIVVSLILAVLTVFMLYGSRMKTYLYINELNSNKEVCSMPSKQQFKCNVYRNGELVGNI